MDRIERICRKLCEIRGVQAEKIQGGGLSGVIPSCGPGWDRYKSEVKAYLEVHEAVITVRNKEMEALLPRWGDKTELMEDV